VVVQDNGAGAMPGLGLFLGKKPEAILDEIRERFGRLDDVHMAEVLDAERGDRPNTYVVTTRLTPQGRKRWPPTSSLFFGTLPIAGERGAPLGMQLYIFESVLLNYVGAWVV